ncbi:MAG: hypothetical protein JWN23_1063 [Rhodocyclales bacterium]|nr:hypothetical protein [Rhodocyclales bacterium]
MKRKLRIAFSLGLIVLICDAIVPFVLAERVTQKHDIANKIEADVHRLNYLLSAYKDTETGERGFMLSGSAEYLEPYVSGRHAIEALLPQIGKSLTTDLAQPAEYRGLLELDRQAVQYQREQIDTRRVGKTTGAEDYKRGKAIMDAIRIKVGAITQRADRLAAAANTSAAALEERSRWLTVAVTIVDVLLFSAAFGFAMRLLHSEEYAGRVAELANEHLLAEGTLRYEAMRKLEAHAHKLNQIIEMQMALSQTTSHLEDFVALVVERMLLLSSASGAVVEMVEGDEVVYLAASGTAADFIGLRMPRASSLSGMSIAEKKVMISQDIASDPRVNHAAAVKIGAAAVVVAPLLRRGEAVGVLKIFSNMTDGFDESDVQTVQLVAGLLGAALADRLAFETNTALLEERTCALAALGQQQQLLRSITDGIPALVAFIDGDERYQYTNKHYLEMLGKDPLGETIRGSVSEERYEILKEHIDMALSGRAAEFEYRLQTMDGLRYTQIHFIPQFDGDGRTVNGFCVLAWDVHTRKEQEMKWQSRALVDQLTGAHNRFSFVDAVGQALARQHQADNGGKLAVFYLDIDHFKSINDTLGHAAGDSVLSAFAGALKSAIRASDILGRIGGDEFCILLENVGSLDNTRRIADKVLEHVRALGSKRDLPLITTSLGIAFVEGGAMDAAEVIELADAALYEAKQAGRNRHAERSVSTA